MTYIGETYNFKQRWMTHTTSVRGHSIQRVHKHLRDTTYGHIYFMLPIQIVVPVSDDITEQRKERRDVEQWMTNMYRPQLNDEFSKVAKNNTVIKTAKVTRTVARPPPKQRQHLRKQLMSPTARDPNSKFRYFPPITYTTFRWEQENKESHSLDKILYVMYSQNVNGTILINQGTKCMSHVPHYTEAYQDSVVQIQWADGTYGPVKPLKEYTTSRQQLRTANSIKFVQIMYTNKLAVHKAFLVEVLQNRKVWKALTNGTPQLYYELWQAAGLFSKGTTVHMLRAQLRTYCKNKLEYDMFARPTLKIQYNEDVSIMGIRRLIQMISKVIPIEEDLRNFWLSRVRIVFTKLSKIQQVVCNYKDEARNHSIFTPGPCECNAYPTWMKDNTGCVNCRGTTYAKYDTTAELLTINSKNGVYMDSISSSKELCDKLKNFITQWVAPQMQGRPIPSNILQNIYNTLVVLQRQLIMNHFAQ